MNRVDARTRDVFDAWVAERFNLYDRNGRPIKWSEMRLLKWGPSNYETVRRLTVRDALLVTTWLPMAADGNYGREFFETLLIRNGTVTVLHRASTEMQAIRLHYLSLGELLFELGAPLSEVRGWLEIEA